MAEPPVEPLPLEDVVDFVNEYADAARDAAGEQDLPLPELSGPLAEAAGRRSSRRLVAVANALYPVFAQTDSKAVVALNTLLADTGVAPRLAVGPDRAAAARWIVTAGGDRLVASAALSLWLWLIQAKDRRVGVCAADRCMDVFIDHSPARVRKYCSSTCLTRTKVAAHRARKRAVQR